MENQDLDALVVRAPDNILYLTNYWTHEGIRRRDFPREGEPTLIVIEPQIRETLSAMRGTKTFACSSFYHPKGSRPPMIALARSCVGRVARARTHRPRWHRTLAGHADLRPHGGRADDSTRKVISTLSAKSRDR